MNELTPISLDSAWMFGAIIVSFFAGCVYRLCVLLGRDSQMGASSDSEVDDLSSRYDREMLHVRQLQNELLQVRRAVEQRIPADTPSLGLSASAAPLAAVPVAAQPVAPAEPAAYAYPVVPATPAVPANPTELGIDPFKLAVSGASINVLMQRCRLSRAEAELVFSIHGAGSGRKTGRSSHSPQASRQAITA